MVKEYHPPNPIPGHCFSYGKTGSGKSWKNLAIAQCYHSYGYKIWDIFGGLRREGPFWCFPSDEKVLWRKFLDGAGVVEDKGPKEYHVDLYYPFFKSKLPSKLPEKLPRITSNIFTIYFKDIGVNDIAVVIGGVSTNQERILTRIKNELPDTSNSQDILEWFEETPARQKTKRFPIYHSFFEPLCNERLFDGKNGKYNINIKEIAKDKNRIFVFAEDYLPDERYRFFFIRFFANKLFRLVNEDKIHKKNILLLREINLFMKVDDESVQHKEQKQILRNDFSNLLRYGRSGVFAICDTQSPREVRSITPGQEGILCLNMLPGAKDREEACERPRRDGRMNSKHEDYLGIMPIQEMAILEQGKKIVKVDNVQPPRTMGWKPETGSFVNVWKKIYNSFMDIKDVKDYINKENKRREIIIKKDLKEVIPEIKKVPEEVIVNVQDAPPQEEENYDVIPI